MCPLTRSSPRQEGRAGRDNSTRAHRYAERRECRRRCEGGGEVESAGVAGEGEVSNILFYAQHGETTTSKEGRGHTSSTRSNCVYQHIQQRGWGRLFEVRPGPRRIVGAHSPRRRIAPVRPQQAGHVEHTLFSTLKMSASSALELGRMSVRQGMRGRRARSVCRKRLRTGTGSGG
jgi:hypothetical protein